MSAPDRLCQRCGHPLAVHQHYRSGTDCGTCGQEACPAYVPAGWWGRLRRVLRAG